MKILYIVTLFVFCICSGTCGQTTLPPTYEIKSDTAVLQVVDDKYWQLLEDPTGKLTIEQVSSPAFSSRFHANTTKTKGYDYKVNTYWLRYRFKNMLAYPVKITIPEKVAYAWLYTPGAGNKWSVKHTGVLVPYSQRDGLKRLTHFLVTLPPGQEILFYEKNIFDFNRYKPKVFEFTIGFADAVIQKNYINTENENLTSALYAISFGILLLAACINLIFFLIVREKVYLYFSIYILFNGLYYLLVKNIAVSFPENPLFNYYSLTGSLIITFFSVAHFVRYFLSSWLYTPRWDKFLRILSVFVVIAWLIREFMPPSLPYNIYLLITLLCSIIIYTYFPFLLFTLLFYIKKSKGAIRLGIYAILPTFIWLGVGYMFLFISFLLFQGYQIPYSGLNFFLREWQPVIEIVTFFWLVIVFCWILLKRFQDTQKLLVQSMLDKERLAKEKEIERSNYIELQKEELEATVAARTADLNQSLQELKTTQSQLIQSEKMASLGELTAGIAHEIQNPLNFVNNFSEVSAELLEELEEEAQNGNTTEVLAISTDLKENLQKINHHGKRADSIVKGMLEHSRTNSGQKELTDINALAEEYLRLSYHGLRAKDKAFNANLKNDFDESIGKVEIVPQEIGRVLLNLFNNAFYATQQKKSQLNGQYQPEVRVTTRLLDGKVEIRVKDNGSGIPENVKNKIFQPFFTTKPTGQGTGLGLSLSYDIITKGHGGELKVETEEGVGTVFFIILPVKPGL